MIIKEDEKNKYFLENENASRANIPNCGKWMFYFKLGNEAYIDKLITKAMTAKVCSVVKRTVNPKQSKKSKREIKDVNVGVVCFYLDINDMVRHKKVIKFMLDNRLIKTNNDGALWNISFKLDKQTRNHQYTMNGNYYPVLRLKEIIDLRTRKWKV